MNEDTNDTVDTTVLGPEEPVQFRLGGTKKFTDWKAEPDLMLLKGDLEAAKPSHDAWIANIKRWNNLLKVEGEAKPPKVKGRSTVQPKLVRRQAEWRYSALSEPFLSSDKLFKVSPVTFEDGPAARQNEIVLNHQFRTKLNRVRLVDNLVRATVDEGTCVAQVGWCRYTKKVPVEVPVYAYYPLESQEQAQPLQQAIDLKSADPRTYQEQVPPEIRAAVDYYEETNTGTYAVQTGTQTQQEEKIYDNRPTVKVHNPANVYIDPSCEGDLDQALFIIVSFETNKAELLKEPERYKNIGQVNWEGNTTVTDGDHASGTPDSFNFRDSPRKKVVAYEYWGFYDIEGNGELQPIVATWIGDTIIRMEKNPYPDNKLPFVIIPYLPNKRELYGEPDAELLEDNQKILGAVTRGMIDLLARSANGQRGFAKSMLDPNNRRKYEDGQDYEFNPTLPTNQGIIEHTYPEIPQSALQMTGMMNMEAEALTGVKSFAGGLSGDAYGNVATGIKGMLDAAAKREMGILRRIAKGVSDIGRKILCMNSEFLKDEEIIRITNEAPVPGHERPAPDEAKYITIKREELKGEFDTIVDISTYEVDNAKAQDLGFMLQTLGPNMDPSINMMILSEIADLKRMPVLAERLRRWHPQPDPVQQQLQQLELQKVQMEIQVMQSEMTKNQAQAQAFMASAGMKNLERVEQEAGVKHARNIIETQAQGRANQHLEVTKALLKGRKAEETKPDVNAAIGYNALSNVLEKDDLLNPNQQ